MQEEFWPSLCGQHVGSYYLVRYLGNGAMGAVYEAIHIVDGRRGGQVALKLIAPNGQFLRYQYPELLQGVDLHHPHIVRMHTAGGTELLSSKFFYLVMELAPGGSLESKIVNGPLSESETLRLLQQCASALAYMATRRLVHRDIKPANILCFEPDYKISDFGCLRTINTTDGVLDHTQIQFGSMRYMPYEAFGGVVSPAFDVWSLGVSAADALLGAPLFPAQTQQELMPQLLKRPLALPRHVSPALVEILHGCLHPDREKRWTAERLRSAAVEAVQSRAALALNETEELEPLSRVNGTIASQNREHRLRRQMSRAFLAGNAVEGLRLLRELQEGRQKS